MDSELQKIAAAAAAALVGSMATDGWRKAKDVFAAVCGRNRPEAVQDVSAELEADQQRVLIARRTGDERAEEDVRAHWDGRLRRLVEQRPDAVAELATLLHLPALARSEPMFHTHAQDNAQVYNAGGDMHFGGKG